MPGRLEAPGSCFGLYPESGVSFFHLPSSLYVGMTRGRTANVLHVVAVDEQDAREQFIDAFARDSADRGLDDARKQVERDMHGIIAGNAATVAAEIDQLTHDAAKADQQATVWDDAASQFARLREQQTAELHQLEQAVETTQATAQQLHAQMLAPLRAEAQTDGAEIAALRERATQAQQEARSAGRFGRRRAERDAQTATSKWEQARDRAVDARAEVVELRQLPTDQAADRVQTKHQAAAEHAAREKQLARERAERLRQEQPYRLPQHQTGPNRRGPSLGL